jgi:hypothetical protein
MPLTFSSYMGEFRIGICLVVLAYASVVDKRTGYVSNRFWLGAITSAVISVVFDCIISEQPGVLTGMGFSFLLTFGVALVMFRIGVFGGSDAKALMVLSLFIPTSSPYLLSRKGPIITPLSTLVNLVTLLGLFLCINAFRNLYFIRKKHENRLGPLSPKERAPIALFGYRRMPSSSHVHNEAPKSRVDDSCVNEAGGSSSYEVSGGVMEPLRIPLIPIITLSLVFSLLIGDLPTVLLI